MSTRSNSWERSGQLLNTTGNYKATNTYHRIVYEDIWISVIDLDYADRQMKLAPETSTQCIFAVTGKNVNGFFRFLKGFYAPADIPTVFQEKIDKTLGHQTPLWVDDIIVVFRGTKEEHTHPGIIFGTYPIGKQRVQSKQKEINILSERINMSRTHNFEMELDPTKKTRRERLKSALYLRLKKRKTFFAKKT